jgi:hypothetical protein
MITLKSYLADRAICLFLILIAFVPFINAESKIKEKEFIVFDLISAIDKPVDLPLTKMHMLYQWQSYGGAKKGYEKKDYKNTIPEQYLKCCYMQDNLEALEAEYISIDFEQWRWYDTKSKNHSSYMEHYKNTIGLVRSIFPEGTKISWYNTGVMPRKFDYSKEVPLADLNWWRMRNDVGKQLVNEYDYMQPSFYLRRADSLLGWKKRVELIVSEYRRLEPSKPLYAHLSPQFVDNPKKLVAPEKWREILYYVHDITDGIVIWTYPQKRYMKHWDEHQEWWAVTVEFCNALASQ